MQHSPHALASPACLQAVSAFAQLMGLDAQALLGGCRFEYKGTGFRLEHYGALDPDGVVLVLEIGEFAQGQDDFVCRRLLEHHIQFPAGRFGYYALAPQSNLVLYCMRVELNAGSAHEVIAAAMETASDGIARTLKEVAGVLEEVAAETGSQHLRADLPGTRHAKA